MLAKNEHARARRAFFIKARTESHLKMQSGHKGNFEAFVNIAITIIFVIYFLHPMLIVLCCLLEPSFIDIVNELIEISGMVWV